MLTTDEIQNIREKIDQYWNDQLQNRETNKSFYDMATGKEGGHQLGDKVDQLSTMKISTEYPLNAGYQHKGGKVSTRSMGDIWFKNNKGEWNPINVKTGLVGSEGQPNIVSLKRVMTSIMDHVIDSYYLLMVKFEIDNESKTVSHSVYLTDILNWLEKSVVTFNSGPGQMMLKAKHFYTLLSDGFYPAELSVKRKMELLMNLYRIGEENLIKDREKDREKFEKCYEAFANDAMSFVINQAKQEELEIGCI